MAQVPATVPDTTTIVLSGSLTDAKRSFREHENDKSVCFIAPSPRTEGRMNERQLITAFESIGTTFKEITRAEVHFYATPTVACNARALTALIRRCRKLVYVLFNGMRISGSQEDINDLGNAFQEHPSLARMCLFNIDLVDQSNGRTLVPVVEGIKRNPKLIDVALRYLRWAPSILGDMVDENSIIKTLRLTGKMTFSDIGPERLSRSLRTNTFLKELAINRCDLPKGAEFTISEFLAYNTSLQTFIIELHNFREAIPFAEVLGTSNRILKKIDITCKQRFDPVEFGGGRRRRVGRMNIDNDDDSSNNGSSPPETKKEKEDAIESCKLAFEKTLEENTSLHSVVLTDEVNSNPISITSEKVEMFLTLNRAGRKHLLRNDNLLSSQLMRFITKHNDDPNIVFYTFTTKPNLLAQIIDACTQAAVKARKNGKLQDFGTRVQEMIDNNAHMNRRRTLADEIMSSAMLSNDEKVGMYQKLILDHKKEPPRKKLRLSMQL